MKLNCGEWNWSKDIWSCIPLVGIVDVMITECLCPTSKKTKNVANDILKSGQKIKNTMKILWIPTVIYGSFCAIRALWHRCHPVKNDSLNKGAPPESTDIQKTLSKNSNADSLNSHQNKEDHKEPAQITEIEDVNKQVPSEPTLLEKLENEGRALWTQIQICNTKISNFQDEIIKWKKEITTIENQLQPNRDEISRLQQQKRLLESEIRFINTELHKIENHYNREDRDLTYAKDKVQRLREKNQLCNSSSESQENLENWKNFLAELKKEKKDLNEIIEMHTALLKSHEAQDEDTSNDQYVLEVDQEIKQYYNYWIQISKCKIAGNDNNVAIAGQKKLNKDELSSLLASKSNQLEELDLMLDNAQRILSTHSLLPKLEGKKVRMEESRNGKNLSYGELLHLKKELYKNEILLQRLKDHTNIDAKSTSLNLFEKELIDLYPPDFLKALGGVEKAASYPRITVPENWNLLLDDEIKKQITAPIMQGTFKGRPFFLVSYCFYSTEHKRFVFNNNCTELFLRVDDKKWYFPVGEVGYLEFRDSDHNDELPIHCFKYDRLKRLCEGKPVGRLKEFSKYGDSYFTGTERNNLNQAAKEGLIYKYEAKPNEESGTDLRLRSFKAPV